MRKLTLLICSILATFSFMYVIQPLVSKELIKKQLQEMVDQDQALRFNMLKEMEAHNFSKADAKLTVEIEKLDKKNTKNLKEIVHRYGWVNISTFGQKADHNAWLLVQHADHDIEFQKEVLGMLEKLYPLQETRADHFAYLYDRVAKNENKPQRYGTQGNIVNGRWIPDEIENMEMLDTYRKIVGLPPYQEYLQQLNELLHLDSK